MIDVTADPIIGHYFTDDSKFAYYFIGMVIFVFVFSLWEKYGVKDLSISDKEPKDKEEPKAPEVTQEQKLTTDEASVQPEVQGDELNEQ